MASMHSEMIYWRVGHKAASPLCENLTLVNPKSDLIFDIKALFSTCDIDPTKGFMTRNPSWGENMSNEVTTAPTDERHQRIVPMC